jgi:hypothetical protein
MKPGLGARLCQRCGTRVDERRGKFSPYCLSCGQPLDGQRLSTPASGPFSTATPAARPSAGRAWIVAVVLSVPLVGLTLLLAFGAYRACASGSEAPAAAATATSALPSVEAPTTAVPGGGATAGKIPRTPGPSPTAPGPSPTPRPTPTVHGGGDDPPPFVPHTFPRERADQQLDQAMVTIANCHSSGDPTGSSIVDLTFEGDGRVETTVRPPFAGTATGECISARLLGLRNSVGRFVGGPVTLRRAFTIGR